MSNINSNFNQRLCSLFITNTPDTNPTLEGNFKDLSKNSKRYMSLKRLNPSTMQIKLMYPAGVRLNKGGNPYGFTLPRNFTLVKQ